jgi:hypothetical protein
VIDMSDRDTTGTTPEDGTKKDGGLGSEGTIPNEPGSVGVGAGEPTTFEPEEDPEAAAQRDPDAPERAREASDTDTDTDTDTSVDTGFDSANDVDASS